MPPKKSAEIIHRINIAAEKFKARPNMAVKATEKNSGISGDHLGGETH